ncbi:hypothetical protein CAPN001_13500 [Capnocytophaga stomatis]|uniref:hypothetical protein n=1 Tax=Capnocytophaga stomatis TaxID=1848904 RepID=UPI00194E8345|nr:hypothetical protein [Capnocytophaga stomatis]GIJ94019.1 hypothetical protein CAPN002_12370 [Capnocytophaga stomatis]GIJ96781.1 hypothetical protein CAPN001_13500 [Capnocytophaga stomatis]
MSFTTEIKNLIQFVKEENFIALTDNDKSYCSWVKPLDNERSVYLYIYAYQKKDMQRCYLIVSPPRFNDDSWVGNPLAFGICVGVNWEARTGFFDKCINRLRNLLPNVNDLKNAVIAEISSSSEIATDSGNASELAKREKINLQAFNKLKEQPDFENLCKQSKEAWIKKKIILTIETELTKKCYEPYGDAITMKYIDDYAHQLGLMLATYSIFKGEK